MDRNENDGLILSPNPLNAEVEELHIGFVPKRKIKRVEIYDVLGKKVLTSYNPKKVAVSSLGKGIYIVRAYVLGENLESSKTYHKKLVVK